jgi:cell division septation protein DedD|uniref:Serine/threonine protein kinase n=1 Tax=Desulfobacca acetoxidans TaxID=60893 RepID=A0A7C3SHN5_9BACT
MSIALKASHVLGQRYVILRQLRQEPWGLVYLAQDRLLKVEVGLKFIGRETPEFDLARKFLIQEAAAAYRLRHPLILAVFHGNEDPEGFYLVQEPFVGESLLARLNRREHFNLPQALHLLDQVGRAVAFAHEQGVVHQALNPLHILTGAEKVKVANFACPHRDEGQVEFLELRAYTAPEVLRGGEVTPQANVFSLGVLGFRLTAGSLPYPLTFDEGFPYRLETLPADLEEIPIPLQNFLLGCLAPGPEDRYPNVLSFLNALEQGRELWRASPRDTRSLWQPQTSISLAEKAKAAAQTLWQESKALAGKLIQKLTPAVTEALGRIKSAPPRLLGGLGLALLTVALIWLGARALRAPAPGPRSAPPALTTPGVPVAPAGPPRTAALPAPQAPVTKPTTPGTEEQYLVLVASYSQLNQAQALKNRLKTYNLQAKTVKTTPGGKPMYQVRVGPLAGKAAADQVVRLIKEHEGLSARVAKIPPNSSPQRP